MNLISKKLFKGSILGQLSFFLRMFIALFMTPFMIASLGDHSYGLWILGASFTGFYGLLDIGLTSAVQRYLSRALGNDDIEEANTIFNTSLIVFSIIAIILLIIILILSFFAPLFAKNATDILLLRQLIIIFGLGIVFSFPLRSFWAIFNSHLRWDVNVYLDTINTLMKTLLMVTCLKLGKGLLALSIIYLLCDMTYYILSVIFSLRIAKYIKISFKVYDKKIMKEFLSYSIFSFISQLASTVKINIDNFVISAFLGLSPITIYSIAVRLITYYAQLTMKTVGIIMPVFSQYEAKNDYESIRKYFLFTTKVSGTFSMLIGSLLLLFGKNFIILWIGPEYSQAYTIMVIFIISYTVQLFQEPSSRLLYGISKHKFLCIINVLEAVSNLVLSLILVRHIGLEGVALGTAIPMFVFQSFMVSSYACKKISLKTSKFFIHTILKTFLKSCLIIIPLAVIIKNQNIDNYFLLITYASLFFIIYLIASFYLTFTKQEQTLIINALPYKILKIIKLKNS